ncbi:unnamed protein product [Callosobruchus maculatus]|uniref:BAG domain-containing protein n=1 Tax=Callosobruchus maculatus TaxID=64391 RepID=A0A653CCY9_CALMS|nr:unnamed protein product [Callosobruchus maculatus]
MSSPVVDRVRTIPLVIENGPRLTPMEHEQIGGFPFKRDAADGAAGSGDRDFRSQLDDIAKRHPEFAEHLGKFQHRAPQSAGAADVDPELHRRFERVDPDLHRRFERPFGDRFHHFGFPFDREDFDPEEYAKQFYQQRPQDFYTQKGGSSASQQPHVSHSPPQQPYQSQQPYQQHQQQPYQQPAQPQQQQPYAQPYQSSPPKQNQETQTSPTEPLPPTPIYEREKGNIQQSNSTDLGQQQEPVEDRTQRSASEPPSGKGPRYTSSINIPVNQPNENMSSNQAHSESKERIIPIHIEGRDEPFMPKNVPPTFSSQPHPQPEPMYNQAHFNRHGFGDFPKAEIPIPVQTEPSAKPQHHHQGQQTGGHFPKGGDIPIPVQRDFSPARQQPAAPKAAQQQQAPPQQQQAPPPPQQQQEAQQEQQKPKQQQLGPIEQIQCIQKDVSDLMRQVEVFAGKPKDKQYLYLDEMLTRNMLKLDNIETGGVEGIRNARRECIRCIEKAIGVLESKAAANVEPPKTEETPTATMDVDETSQEPKETQEPMESEAMPTEQQTANVETEAAVENKTNDAGEPMETAQKDQSQAETVPAPSESCEGQENNMAVADAVKKFENKEGETVESENKSEEQKEEKKETKKKGKKKTEKKKE